MSSHLMGERCANGIGDGPAAAASADRITLQALPETTRSRYPVPQ